jgi:hypothetical protein
MLGTPLSQAVLDTSAEPGILKALPLKEVLRHIRKHADLQALYERRGESTAVPTITGGALWFCVRQQKSPICGDFPLVRAL